MATHYRQTIADALKVFDNWYKINGCNAGAPALEQKLLEYIKDEFE